MSVTDRFFCEGNMSKNKNDDTDNEASPHLTVKLPPKLNRFLAHDAQGSLRTKKGQVLYLLNTYMEQKNKQNGGGECD